MFPDWLIDDTCHHTRTPEMPAESSYNDFSTSSHPPPSPPAKNLPPLPSEVALLRRPLESIAPRHMELLLPAPVAESAEGYGKK